MIKEMLKNKDLLVFWTAMTIAACDLLSSGFFTIQEVTAAPSHISSPAPVQPVNVQEAAAQRWAERMARLSAR